MGSLTRATLFSALGAIVAIICWFALQWYLMRDLWGLAVAIGLLAGLGLIIEYRAYDFQAGYVAATVTVFAVFAVKIITFASLQPDEPRDPLGVQRAVLAATIANEALEERSESSAETRAKDWASLHWAAQRELAALDDEEVLRRWQEYRARTGQHGDTVGYSVYVLGSQLWLEASPDNATQEAGAMEGFFDEMFGFKEVVIFSCGVIVAFVTATGRLGSLLGIVTGATYH